jgi:glutathione S-transferase
MKLYDYLPSGNGYKVRLLLAQLDQPYELVEIDIKTGITREQWFLSKNPNGKVPTLELDDGRLLSESHAILAYLAEGTRFVPAEAYERARMWQWMCFEQYSLEPFIGTLRYWRASLGRSPGEIGAERHREKLDGGHRALGILDAHLDGREWVVDGLYTLADIALYAYTHVAREGDFELDRYPRVLAWHERVRAQPGHVPITAG